MMTATTDASNPTSIENVADGARSSDVAAAAGTRVLSPRPMPGDGDGVPSTPAPTPTPQPVAAVEVSPSSTSVALIPILRGTLSRDLELRRDVIRGTWSQSDDVRNATEREEAAQTFEMVRVWRKGEGGLREEETGAGSVADVVDGPYRSSFVISSPTSKTKTRVVREKGLRLSFTKRRVVVGGMKDCHYDISGSGSNQFGPFHLEGRATPNEPAAGCGDAGRTFRIVMRKEYLPFLSPPAPQATSEVVRTLRTKRSYDGGERNDSGNTKKPRMEPAQSPSAVGPAPATVDTGVAAREPLLLDKDGVEYVSRADYDRLFDAMRDLRAQMAQLGQVLASTKVVVVGEGCEKSTPAYTAASGLPIKADDEAVPSLVEDDDSDDGDVVVRGGNARKKGRLSKIEEPPLTLAEQRDLAAAVGRIRSDARLQGVADIIRSSASWIGGDDDEIELDLDRLDAPAQRKLQRFVMKGTKRTKRPRGPSKSSKCTKPSKNIGDLFSPPDSAGMKSVPSLPQRPRKAIRSASKLSSFMAFGRDESTEAEAQETHTSNDGGLVGTPASDASNRGHDDPDDLRAGSDVNWDAAAKSGTTETHGGDLVADDDENIAGDDDSSWAAARKEAAAVRVREAAQRARVEKVRADALLASRRRLAEDAALARERREAQAAAEARLSEKRHRKAESARQAVRDAVKARTGAVRQTLDLQPLSVRVPSEGFLDASPCASPLDFGF